MNRPYTHGTIFGLRRAWEIFRLFAVESGNTGGGRRIVGGD
jgi:hypothetical protein